MTSFPKDVIFCFKPFLACPLWRIKEVKVITCKIFYGIISKITKPPNQNGGQMLCLKSNVD